MKKGQKMNLPAVGGSSLLVIFAVLCMTVFAVLSLSTVLAEQRLSETAAESVAAYYRADLQADHRSAWPTGGCSPPDRRWAPTRSDRS